MMLSTVVSMSRSFAALFTKVSMRLPKASMRLPKPPMTALVRLPKVSARMTRLRVTLST
jgi:hypothetical protein